MNACVEDRIIGLVQTILAQNSLSSEVSPRSHLVDLGMTSMDMVKLMLGVEAEFDLTLPQSEITPDNFRSVHTIQQMVAKQMRLAPCVPQSG